VSTEETDALVIGAGAAGLAAARTFADRGVEVQLLEAASRPGGVMESVREDNFLFERGPNTMRLHGRALVFVRAAGAAAALVKAAPASRKRFLLHGGRLEPVPMDPLAFATSPLLTAHGKMRLLAEPFHGRGNGARETVAEFAARRLGPEVAEALVAPFLMGIYAGDEHQLGAASVFPSLVAYEREAGSIVVGALRARFRDSGPAGAAGSWSGAGGLGAFAEVLAQPLGARVQLATPVRALARDGGRWRVETEHRSWTARRLVLAVPAGPAAKLLAPLAADAAQVAETVTYAPMVSVPLSVDPTAATHPIEGFGYLVSGGEGLDLLGALFMSRLFRGRAPRERQLIQAMIGGMRWPGAFDASEAELLDRIAAGLERGLGLRGGFEPLAFTRWERAVPQPGVGHPERIAAARAALAGDPPVELAGSWVDGVSLSDSLASGHEAALRLMEARA
jgi:oxygen-dependent protoporphyrinogen oxidase